jgi:hypothetical protein
MSQQRDHIIEHFKAWWENANKLLRLFVENVVKDLCVGSIFGYEFHFLLMQRQAGSKTSVLMTTQKSPAARFYRLQWSHVLP